MDMKNVKFSCIMNHARGASGGTVDNVAVSGVGVPLILGRERTTAPCENAFRTNGLVEADATISLSYYPSIWGLTVWLMQSRSFSFHGLLSANGKITWTPK